MMRMDNVFVKKDLEENFVTDVRLDSINIPSVSVSITHFLYMAKNFDTCMGQIIHQIICQMLKQKT